MGWNFANKTAEQISKIGGTNLKIPDPKKPVPRNAEIGTFVKDLDQQRVWFLDGSLLSSLQLTYWWRVLDTPMCVLIYGHPIHMALKQNFTIESDDAKQFYKNWENFYNTIIQSCAEANLSVVPINLHHVGSDPKVGADHIFDLLKIANMRKFHRVFGPNFFSPKSTSDYKVEYSINHPALSFPQQMLLKELTEAYNQEYSAGHCSKHTETC